MRFRIVFEKDLVSSKYSKSWFIADKENCLTSEILSQISELFQIHQPCHAELDDFLIPDNQIFDKIVKEGEIVNIKRGKFTLTVFKSKSSAYEKKTEKKIIKKEVCEDSSSESEPVPKKYTKGKYLEESSESSSEEIVRPVVKKVQNTNVTIKSLLVKQPEPEFKQTHEYNLEDFQECRFEDLEVEDEVLFKHLELKDNGTPEYSEYKRGKIMNKGEEGVDIRILGQDLQEEISQIEAMDIVDELELEKFQVSLQKNMIRGLMKKKRNI